MRLTSTNSGPDSKGVVRFGRWEFEGEAYLFVVAGAIGTVLIFLLAARLAFALRGFVALLPLSVAIGWVRYFLVGRPPHFTGDFFEKLVVGANFNLRPSAWTRLAHPRASHPRNAGRSSPI